MKNLNKNIEVKVGRNSMNYMYGSQKYVYAIIENIVPHKELVDFEIPSDTEFKSLKDLNIDDAFTLRSINQRSNSVKPFVVYAVNRYKGIRYMLVAKLSDESVEELNDSFKNTTQVIKFLKENEVEMKTNYYYTDDYAYDNAVNFQKSEYRDVDEKDIESIISDLKCKSYTFKGSKKGGYVNIYSSWHSYIISRK